MSKITNASFQLGSFKFTKLWIDIDEADPNSEIQISFDPSGVFHNTEKRFDLTIEFRARFENSTNDFIRTSLIGSFSFEDVDSFEGVPDFFYRNSIAILFPYIRAFISSITVQANILPVVLPTLNLSTLENRLREQTEVAE
jgi:preprotein translocase subunit SecB